MYIIFVSMVEFVFKLYMAFIVTVRKNTSVFIVNVSVIGDVNS